MKKYLPIVLLLIGAIVLVVSFFVIRSGRGDDFSLDDETALIEVSLKDRPIVSLTPSSDGHYLYLKVDKIVIDAESMDYELLYTLENGLTQGVPGTVMLDGRDSFEAELLLGSESSGKFRYDEGVEKGSVTLRFRNDKGKLLVKFATEFGLLSGVTELLMPDSSFTYNLEGAVDDEYFVVMETFGFPGNLSTEPISGPYGVFSSSGKKLPGNVDMEGSSYLMWDGAEWKEISGGESSDIGLFVGI